ncbi:triphosphoribosyl-dephospho-CoA synthase MdcB, partial [Serratia rubidaea]|nr:triphosphoribosyl-dephospho-CoA synthase MdcB [Serratia rubidaea]
MKLSPCSKAAQADALALRLADAATQALIDEASL